MPKISQTILAAVAVAFTVLTISACGGSSSNNGWSSSDVNKLKAKFNSQISTLKNELPKADRTKFQNAANTFLNCTLSVVEPVAKPSVALNNNWNPPKAVQTKLTSKCEAPFEKSVKSLVPNS